MERGHPRKKLSKNLLQMKFMKRTKEKTEIENENEERQAMFARDISDAMRKQGSRFVIEPSFVPVENLLFGRFSYKGMNPDIEKMMSDEKIREEEAAAAEAETDVGDSEMANRFQSLVSTVGRKFAAKRNNPCFVPQSSDPVAQSKEFLNKLKADGKMWNQIPPAKKPKFIKPTDD